MNNILWYQSSDSEGKSVYTIDGVISEFENTTQQITAIDIMRNASKWHQVNRTPNIYIHPNKGILIKSHFQSLDTCNRRITYMFYSSDSIHASQTLREYVVMNKMKLSDNETTILDNSINRYNEYRKIIKLIVTFIVIIILLIAIINMFN